MAENLLFRRGSIQNLDQAPIIPGAISVTTDEPGIYLDLGSTEPGSGGTNKRVRVGDFIPVDNLEALEDRLKSGEKFSTTALYYVVNKNMLLRYDGAKFVWINDFSALTAEVTELKKVDGNLQNAIDDLDTAIKAEATARGNAVEDLQDQIDGITGVSGSGVSLSSLKSALEAETAARTSADATHTRDIATNTSNIASNNAAIGELSALIGTLPSGVSQTVVAYLSGLISTETSRAQTAEAGIKSTAESALSKANTNATNLSREISRAEAAESDLDDKIDANTSLINGVRTDLTAETNRATKKEGELNSAIAGASAEIVRVENKLDTNTTNLTSDISKAQDTANSALSKANTNATNLADEITNRTTAVNNLDTKFTNANEAMGNRVGAVESRVSTAESDIVSNATAISDEEKRAKAKENELAGLIEDNADAIDQERSDRQTAINGVNETIGNVNKAVSNAEGRIGANETAIANLQAADQATTQSLNNLNTLITNEAKTARAAEKANADAITAEVTRAKAAEATLQGNINTEIGNRENAVTSAINTAKGYTDEKIADLEDQITDEIAAANSMHFKGEIKSFSDLPLTNIEGGWTYLITQAMNNHAYHIGDLLVARTDFTGTHTAGSAAQIDFWIHVPTGYSTFNEAKLAVNSGKIELQSHVGDKLGSIAVVSGCDNVVTSVTGSGTDCTINVNLVWGTFV